MFSPHKKFSRPSPILVIGFGILAVSSASILIRYAQHEAPSLVIAFFRLGIAAIILAPYAIFKQRHELMHISARNLILAVFSGILLGLHFAAWITSLEYTSVASSVVLVATAPLWVAILSPILLKEKLTREIIIGMIIALLGAVLVGMNQTCSLNNGIVCDFSGFLSEKALVGNLLALAGAWFSAGYMMAGRRLRPSLSLASYTFLVYGLAAVSLAGLVGAAGLPVTGYGPATWIWFLLLALIPQLLGHSSFNYALRYLPVTYVSITLLGEPIGTTLLAMIILRENPSPLEIIGGGFILVGILISSRLEPGKKTPPETPQEV